MSVPTIVSALGSTGPSVLVDDRTWGTRAAILWAVIGSLAGTLCGTFVAMVFTHRESASLSSLSDISGPIDYLPVTAGMVPGAVFGAVFAMIFGLPSVVSALGIRDLIRLPRIAGVALALGIIVAAAAPAAYTLRAGLSDPPRNRAVSALQKWGAERYDIELSDDQAGALLDFVNDPGRPDSLPLGGVNATSHPDDLTVSLSADR